MLKPQRVSPLRFFAWSAALGVLIALVGAAVLVGLIGPVVLIGAIALVVLGIVVHDEASFDWFGDSMAAFAEIIHQKSHCDAAAFFLGGVRLPRGRRTGPCIWRSAC